jgi:hypothetical protein
MTTRGTMRILRLPDRGRFFAKVRKDGPLFKGTPCWLWTAGKNKKGYGYFSICKHGKVRFFSSPCLVLEVRCGPY